MTNTIKFVSEQGLLAVRDFVIKQVEELRDEMQTSYVKIRLKGE